jgi:uncharacterized protein
VYGAYPGECTFADKDVAIQVKREGGGFRYTRVLNGTMVKKLLPWGADKIIISPVEPVNLPEEITKCLEVVFEPLLVGPGESQRIYLTFPLEIGVFISAKNVTELLDLFTLNQPKYSLYGPPRSGVICKWCKSQVYHYIPRTDPLREGIVDLEIQNNSQTWIEVSRAVFEADGMFMYYGESVAMTARMTIISKTVAETTFIDKPMDPGMTRAIELYKARAIPGVGLYTPRLQSVVEKKAFLMEWGLR